MKTLRMSYVIVPVVIGLSVVAWMFSRDFNPELFKGIRLSGRLVGGLLLGFVCMFGHDLSLITRFRLLSDKALSWRQAFTVDMLGQFTSAVAPTVVGGSSLVILFLHKEGLNTGRSTALMIICLFLDELFFSVACALAFLLFPFHELFGEAGVVSTSIKVLFFTIYTVIVVWTLLLYIALFHHPEWVKKIFRTVFRLPFLRRWSKAVEQLGDNLIMSSKEISGKSFLFWLKIFGLTCVAWCSRYLVVNALFFAFSTSGSQLLAFARQLILWIVTIISPTPGGSGVSEYMFKVYYADYFTVPGMALVVAFVWRIITYYIYLVIGVIIIPGWLKKWNKTKVV